MKRLRKRTGEVIQKDASNSESYPHFFRQKRIEDDMLRNIKSQNYKLKKEDDKENRDQYDELTK